MAENTKQNAQKKHDGIRVLGLGLITGAANDDPSAIGIFASAGAKLGPSILWTAPLAYPMMFIVVYLSSKLGQVTGQGLFKAIQKHYPGWLLYLMLTGVLIGNTIQAGADIGGIAAALDLFIPVPQAITVSAITILILILQIWGSYTLIRNIFRWLSLSLLAYIVSAVLAKPELPAVIKGTLIPHISLNAEFLSILIAVLGATVSQYLFTWQSNTEVEEMIVKGQTKLSERKGASFHELKKSQSDIGIGMLFSNLVMYFIILSTASTLFKNGSTDIQSAAQAAKALEPLAGNAASYLFAIGIVAVGFLAVPVMTTGASYNLCQTLGWKYGLHTRPKEAPRFYSSIIFFSLIALGMNFIGINPMKALVWAGMVQGFLTPPLLLLIMLMTNNPEVMGKRVNGFFIKLLGWITTIVTFAVSIGLIVTWIV